MDTFGYFKQICAIPRESGNEEGIRKFLLSWAKDNNFEATTDKAGNVIVRREASEGYENVPPVCLQGHMDMVCVKKPGSNHNFLTDPVETVEKDGFLYAKDTSLGADNGIALAMIMALFTDPEAKHGKLEALFTVSEETGMFGAFGLEPQNISSRRMINLDSEEEGVIYIGCAGGTDVEAFFKANPVTVPEDWEPVFIKVCGLKGGHSGGEIHRQRANAIKVLGLMLSALEKENKPFMLNSIEGGTRRNVIPSEAMCVICLPTETKKTSVNLMLHAFEQAKAVYAVEDPGMTTEHHCSHHDSSLKKPEKAFSPSDSAKLARALLCIPHGVASMSKAVEGVVETSQNLAVIKTEGNCVSIEISIRSLVEFDKETRVRMNQYLLQSFGFETKTSGDYPSWAPDRDSALCAFCAKAWKDVTGKDAVITSIHAGLECGVINSRIPGMDSVSIGPDLFDVHSTNEHLSAASASRVYDFVKHLLSIIR